jgi:hypothetical protein
MAALLWIKHLIYFYCEFSPSARVYNLTNCELALARRLRRLSAGKQYILTRIEQILKMVDKDRGDAAILSRRPFLDLTVSPFVAKDLICTMKTETRMLAREIDLAVYRTGLR